VCTDVEGQPTVHSKTSSIQFVVLFYMHGRGIMKGALFHENASYSQFGGRVGKEEKIELRWKWNAVKEWEYRM